MHPDAYTDDAICRAMGLGQFAPAPTHSVIRVLFKPSFHPEVCVTVWLDKMQILALDRMLWHEDFPKRLPEHAEVVQIEAAQFQQLLDAIGRAQAEFMSLTNYAIADGMSVSVIWIDDERRVSLEGHPIEQFQREFAAAVISLSHSLASSARLRNRLAHCADYVGLKLPREDETDSPDASRLMVLGNPEDRNEVVSALRKEQKIDAKRY